MIRIKKPENRPEELPSVDEIADILHPEDSEGVSIRERLGAQGVEWRHRLGLPSGASGIELKRIFAQKSEEALRSKIAECDAEISALETKKQNIARKVESKMEHIKGQVKDLDRLKHDSIRPFEERIAAVEARKAALKKGHENKKYQVDRLGHRMNDQIDDSIHDIKKESNFEHNSAERARLAAEIGRLKVSLGEHTDKFKELAALSDQLAQHNGFFGKFRRFRTFDDVLSEQKPEEGDPAPSAEEVRLRRKARETIISKRDIEHESLIHIIEENDMALSRQHVELDHLEDTLKALQKAKDKLDALLREPEHRIETYEQHRRKLGLEKRPDQDYVRVEAFEIKNLKAVEAEHQAINERVRGLLSPDGARSLDKLDLWFTKESVEEAEKGGLDSVTDRGTFIVGFVNRKKELDDASYEAEVFLRRVDKTLKNPSLKKDQKDQLEAMKMEQESLLARLQTVIEDEPTQEERSAASDPVALKELLMAKIDSFNPEKRLEAARAGLSETRLNIEEMENAASRIPGVDALIAEEAGRALVLCETARSSVYDLADIAQKFEYADRLADTVKRDYSDVLERVPGFDIDHFMDDVFLNIRNAISKIPDSEDKARFFAKLASKSSVDPDRAEELFDQAFLVIERLRLRDEDVSEEVSGENPLQFIRQIGKMNEGDVGDSGREASLVELMREIQAMAQEQGFNPELDALETKKNNPPAGTDSMANFLDTGIEMAENHHPDQAREAIEQAVALASAAQNPSLELAKIATKMMSSFREKDDMAHMNILAEEVLGRALEKARSSMNNGVPVKMLEIASCLDGIDDIQAAERLCEEVLNNTDKTAAAALEFLAQKFITEMPQPKYEDFAVRAYQEMIACEAPSDVFQNAAKRVLGTPPISDSVSGSMRKVGRNLLVRSFESVRINSLAQMIQLFFVISSYGFDEDAERLFIDRCSESGRDSAGTTHPVAFWIPSVATMLQKRESAVFSKEMVERLLGLARSSVENADPEDKVSYARALASVGYDNLARDCIKELVVDKAGKSETERVALLKFLIQENAKDAFPEDAGLLGSFVSDLDTEMGIIAQSKNIADALAFVEKIEGDDILKDHCRDYLYATAKHKAVTADDFVKVAVSMHQHGYSGEDLAEEVIDVFKEARKTAGGDLDKATEVADSMIEEGFAEEGAEMLKEIETAERDKIQVKEEPVMEGGRDLEREDLTFDQGIADRAELDEADVRRLDSSRKRTAEKKKAAKKQSSGGGIFGWIREFWSGGSAQK